MFHKGCSLGVMRSLLSDNYTQLALVFETAISVAEASAQEQFSCKYLFDDAMSQALGQGAQCQVTASQRQITITFGSNPQLPVYQNLQVKPGTVKQKVGCDGQYFARVVDVQQHSPYNPQAPIVEYKYPTDTLSLCVPLKISVLFTANDGRKMMNSVKWSLMQVSPAETNATITQAISLLLLD